MPNHVTNRLTFEGDEGRIKEMLASIGEDVPKKPHVACDGKIICVKSDETELTRSVGWLDEQSGKFEHRSCGMMVGLDSMPDGWEIEYVEAHRDHILFHKIVPPPDVPAYRDEPTQDEARNSPDWWHTWNTKNWGTKWGAYSIRECDGGIVFDTAWSAPTPVIAALSKLWPDIKFSLESIDEGWNFASIVEFMGGEIISYTDIPCSKTNPVFCDLHIDLLGRDPREKDEED